MTAYEWLIRYLEASGAGRSGRNWQCPAHPDGSPSLSVSEGDGGSVLIHCFSGCSTKAVMAALGLGLGALFEAHPYPAEKVLSLTMRKPTFVAFAPSSGGSAGRRAWGQPISVEHHVYIRDEVRMERRRFAGAKKECRWEVRVGRDWRYSREGEINLSALPLYQDQQLRMALGAEEPIVLCESESSVDALLDAGIYATTWAGGASNPQMGTLRQGLAGAKVLLIPDNDPPGVACGNRIIDALTDVCDLKVLWPDVKSDARDLLVQKGSDFIREEVEGFAMTANDNHDNDSHAIPCA